MHISEILWITNLGSYATILQQAHVSSFSMKRKAGKGITPLNVEHTLSIILHVIKTLDRPFYN